MRHLARPFTALFALWFAIMLGDPGMLHTCAMHGGHGGHGRGAAQAAPAAAEHHTQMAHGAHGAAHAAAPGDTQQPAAPGPCTCIGHCCAVTVAAPLPAVAVLPVPVAVAEERHPLDAPTVEAPAAPDRRLPFANGPPTV
jgi:hypothetical protein